MNPGSPASNPAYSGEHVGCDHNPEGELTEVVLAALCVDGRWLQIARAEGVPAAGRVGFCGGKIEEGETQAEAVVREVLEEVGLDVEPVRRLGCAPTPRWGAHNHLWQVKPTQGALGDDGGMEVAAARDSSEVADVLWLTYTQLTTTEGRLESNDDLAHLLPRL